jgi:hypothetical protein
MMVNMLPLPASAAGRAMGPFPSNDAIRLDFGKAFRDTAQPDPSNLQRLTPQTEHHAQTRHR